MVYFQKPPAVGGKAGAGPGASTAVKSRLAAVKAAMRAKQTEQKASETSHNIQDDADPVPAAPAATQTVVFHGGFFQSEHLADSSEPQLEECIPESMLSPSSQEEPQEDMVSEASLPPSR
ncbi:unnamed protein product [Leuciscus chuanchicus]